MDPLAVAALLLLLVFVASVLSVEAALSVAIIEILAGVVAGNVFGIRGAPWLDFLAQFGSMLLTLLAVTEVDPRAWFDGSWFPVTWSRGAAGCAAWSWIFRSEATMVGAGSSRGKG